MTALDLMFWWMFRLTVAWIVFYSVTWTVIRLAEYLFKDTRFDLRGS